MTNPETDLNLRVAEELRAILARRRLSASQLARMTGMTQRAVSRRLTGEKAIDIGDLDLIARALGVPITDLIPTAERTASRGAGSDTATNDRCSDMALTATRPQPSGGGARVIPSPRTRRPALVGAAAGDGAA